MKYKRIALGAGALLLIPIGWQAGGALGAVIAAHATLIGLVVGALLLALALGGLRIVFAAGRLASARARQAELTQLQNGQPLHISDVSRYAAPLIAHTLDRHYDVEERRATANPALSHLHIEQHPAASADLLTGLLGGGPPQSPAPQRLAGPSPDLAQAMHAGWSAPDRWFVGIDASGTAQTAALKHTGMVAVSGVPGTGKTSAAAWLAAQSAAHGGLLFVADPHYGDPESLSARIAPFAGAVERFATTPEEINALIILVAKIYDRRCNHPADQTRPILLLIDEFMQLMLRKQLTDESERALATLAGGGRKKDVFGALIAQNWSAAAMGQKVTVLRQIVTGSLVHQSDEDTAKFLLPRGYTTAAATLAPGEALWFGSGVPIIVRVPYLSPADAALAAKPHQPRPHRMAGTPAATTPLSSATAPIAPTERVAPQPPREAPETARLPDPTVKDQIVMLLDARAGQWLTHSEIAAALTIDVKVISTEAKDLYDSGVITRRATRRNNERVEYATNQPTNAYRAPTYAKAA